MRPTCVFEILQLATTVLTVTICHWKDSGSKAGMSNDCPLGRSLSEKATMGHLHLMYNFQSLQVYLIKLVDTPLPNPNHSATQFPNYMLAPLHEP